MNNGKDHNELNNELLEKYLRGELSPDEKARVEALLDENPFYKDALEGMKSIGAEELESDLDELHSRLETAVTRERKDVFRWYRIAAALVVIMSSVLLVIWYSGTPDKEETAVATEMAEEKSEAADEVVPEESLAEEQDPAEGTEAEPLSPETETLAKADDPAEDQPVTEGIAANEGAAGATGPADLMDTVETDVVIAQQFQAEPVVTLEEEEALEEVVVADEAAEAEDADFAVAGEEALTRQERSKEKKAARDAAPAAARRSSTQWFELNGAVYDGSDGFPLEEVVLQVEGTSIQTTTDMEGRYRLRLPDEYDGVLNVLADGYSDLKVAVEGKDYIAIDLAPDVASTETVIVDYGVQETEADSVRMIVNAIPEGGRSEFKKYVNENLDYPEAARDNDISGRVTVEFFVQADGSLKDFRIRKSLGFGCDEEAIRLIQEGPAWKPATINGAPVSRKVRLRLKFPPG